MSRYLWRCAILQYEIGQNVIHPSHGPGEIVGVTEMDLVDGFTNYYVIEFARQLTLHIPVRKTDELGLRKTMSKANVADVFATLRDNPHELPDEYKLRHQKIEGLLQSGHPVEIAKAVRELAWREKSAGLSKIDGDLFTKGKEMLATEIALVTGSDLHEAQEKINLALTQAVTIAQAELGLAPLQ